MKLGLVRYFKISNAVSLLPPDVTGTQNQKMKVGLVRHFKVKHKFPKKVLLTAAEVVKWFEDYEVAELEYKDVDLCRVEWRSCFTSPLERAAKTASTLFNGEIIKADELKELEALPLMNKTIRLPFLVWAIIIRIKFSTSNKITTEFKTKIIAFVDQLIVKHDKDVLIVSHGFVMMTLQKELLKRGFSGNTFRSPAYGKVYVFEK